MLNYGFFVTKSGKSVLEKQNPLNYIVNTNHNTFKIYKQISGLISVPSGGSANVIVTHGLQYYPAFLAYYRLKKASQVWWLDFTSMNTSDSDNGGYRSQGTEINTGQIGFSALDGEAAGASDIEFKAFIMVNPIDLVGSGITGIPLTPGFGFKASKPNIDVTKAKAHELLISSKYDSLKFHMERQAQWSVNNPATEGHVSFEHGLGYIPMFTATALNPNDATKQGLAPIGRVPQAAAMSVKADKSTITAVGVQGAGFNITYNAKITVFKNKLSDA